MQSLLNNEQNMAKKLNELEARMNATGGSVNIASIQAELTAIKGGFNA